MREMGAIHSVSEGAIRKRAKRDEWTKDLKAKIKAVKLKIEDVRTKAGFVYVIFFDDSSGNRFYKIGLSQVFSDRLKSHACSNPFDLYVAIAYFTADMRAEEKYLHARFHAERIRGEWFKLDGRDLAEIASRSLLV